MNPGLVVLESLLLLGVGEWMNSKKVGREGRKVINKRLDRGDLFSRLLFENLLHSTHIGTTVPGRVIKVFAFCELHI